MTKSRRVMAVIVAALLIVAMILPGLVVKAEAAEGEKTGETGCVTTKLTIESKDNKTLQYKPGESQKWTLVITNKTGKELSNLSVSPDMGGENADEWPFKTDYQKYEQKIDTLKTESIKRFLLIFCRETMLEHADMLFRFLCIQVIMMS